MVRPCTEVINLIMCLTWMFRYIFESGKFIDSDNVYTTRPLPLARGVPGGDGGQAPVPDRHPDRQSRPRRETPVKGE